MTSHAVGVSCRVPFAGELSVGGAAPESPEECVALMYNRKCLLLDGETEGALE